MRTMLHSTMTLGIFWALLSGAAQAGEPAAIVLDISGQVTPRVEAFDELADGTRLDLGEGALLRLSAYEGCAEYEISTGTVEIRDGKIIHSGGGAATIVTSGCVAKIAMSDADVVSAGVVTRTSGGETPSISQRPSFGITGPNADSYDRVAVVLGDETVLSMPVTDRRAEFPGGATPLAAGTEAVVIISGAGVQQRAVRVKTGEDATGWTILN
jgi:hypothetical protein